MNGHLRICAQRKMDLILCKTKYTVRDYACHTRGGGIPSKASLRGDAAAEPIKLVRKRRRHGRLEAKSAQGLPVR